MPHLFDPLSVRSVTLSNRIGVSPMCQYWIKNGVPTDWHLVHLGSRAIGGAGLVIAEATAVEPRGRITTACTGIWNDEQATAWSRVAQFVEHYGAVPGMQLAHAGRKASTWVPWERAERDTPLSDEDGGWQPVAPSPLPFRNGSRMPKELTVEEIAAIQKNYVAATQRVLNAGFRWLELHFAHGYLCNSFLSPLTNHRTDQYGGSFENRIRFAMETVQAVRKVWPDSLPLSVRLSVTDWAEGGWGVQDSIALSKLMKPEGVDLIDCSSGFVVSGVRYPTGPGWQVPLSDAVRSGTGMLTATVGQITEPHQADEIIRSGKADVVLLASKMLADPYWPFHAAQALNISPPLKMPPPYDYVVNGAAYAAQARK